MHPSPFIFSVILGLCLLVLPVDGWTQKPLFILIGQSNMAGRAPIPATDTAILPRVQVLDDKGQFIPAQHPLNAFSSIRKDLSYQRLGPGYAFAKTLTESLADTLLLVVNARGGTELQRWVKGSSHGYYEQCLRRVRQALLADKQAYLAAIIWHQGESNRNKIEGYLPLLKQMVSDYRSDLQAPNLPFIAGDLGNWNSSYEAIRTQIAQIPTTISHASLVSSEGLTPMDEHHFDTPSQLELGRRYAQAYLESKQQTPDKRLPFAQLQRMLFQPVDSYVMVVAHRGDWRHAPENSLRSIQYCIDMGADMVEIDVRLTKDGVPVLLHDKTLDRTTTGQGRVADVTWEQVNQLKLTDKDGKPTDLAVPSLADAMRLAKGKILINLDKVDEILPEVYQVLKETQTIDQVVWGSYLSLQEMRALAGPYLDSLNFMPKIKQETPDIASFLDTYEAALDFSVLQVRLETVDVPHRTYLRQGKQFGSWIWVNSLTPNRSANHDDEQALIDPHENYGWLIDQGANMIQTDRPALLLDYLKKRGLHP